MKHVTIAIIVSVWFMFALLLGIIGTAVILCQWVAGVGVSRGRKRVGVKEFRWAVSSPEGGDRAWFVERHHAEVFCDRAAGEDVTPIVVPIPVSERLGTLRRSLDGDVAKDPGDSIGCW